MGLRGQNVGLDVQSSLEEWGARARGPGRLEAARRVKGSQWAGQGRREAAGGRPRSLQTPGLQKKAAEAESTDGTLLLPGTG